MQSDALKVLGIEKKISPIELVELGQRGFTKQNYLKLKNAIGFSHEMMASILSVNRKTLERYSKGKRLDDKISERLLKLAEVFTLGTKAFGSSEIFLDWLNRPHGPLDGKRPIDLMAKIYGLEFVKNSIGRMKHSVIHE